ncbi:Chromatin structure-remodeling complex protein RSC8 [Wickerhamiella sorbophila]|uniref:Chromatin structure-remodeling complex protein RSC8 n=1 Tax=Wickerhamiella sorbophila TaxID=45607 RepID=A0A2T0FK65_9ASCO|nr:Chromatin structure-remodeling complex protein RSC8 [Wickerhamiella sorbophila]PRT55365.1 Chromatin structure-remodeling complex protein RSC8 [Wickerhamiella sorbophila]
MEEVVKSEPETPASGAVTSTEPVQPSNSSEPAQDEAQLQAQIEERSKHYLARQVYRVIIPSFARWFDREIIHEVEKKGLPEFFSEKNRTKTSEVYLQYRNFMIDTYRLNPTEYLTVTACRRNLAGDVGAIMRVHRFLEAWGLINYQIDPETRPSLVGPQYTGHFQILLDTPRGLEPAMPLSGSEVSTDGKELPATETLAKASSEKAELNTTPLNLELRRSVYDSSADAMALLDENQRKFAALTTRQYTCFTCGEDVSKVRYHNLQSKQLISAMAFTNGLFPSNFTSDDYVKMTQLQLENKQWTDQELLLLLEGIEMYDYDWDAVAYHVGTRSSAACVTKFLQLPIEDPYLVKNASSRLRRRLAGAEEVKVEESSGADNNSTVQLLSEIRDLLAKNPAAVGDKAAKALQDVHGQQLPLLSSAVSMQLEKLELKMAKFDKLEDVLKAQKRELDTARLELYLDRLSLNQQADKVLTTLRQATAESGEEAVRLAEQAVQLARECPKSQVLQDISEPARAAKVPNPTLRPVSLDTPHQYKFWSA